MGTGELEQRTEQREPLYAEYHLSRLVVENGQATGHSSLRYWRGDGLLEIQTYVFQVTGSEITGHAYCDAFELVGTNDKGLVFKRRKDLYEQGPMEFPQGSRAELFEIKSDQDAKDTSATLRIYFPREENSSI